MNKIITLILSFAGIMAVSCAAQVSAGPVDTDPCPLLTVNSLAQQQCCYYACRDHRLPVDAYQACASEIYERYNCNGNKRTIMSNNFFNCKCR
jgi:hypothetical protein